MAESLHAEHLADHLYLRGTELYEKGDLKGAEREFLKLLEINPRFADIQNKMGYILHNRGDLRGAAEYFQKALDLNPSYTEASLNLAVTLNDLGEYQRSQDAVTRAAQLAHENRGQLGSFTSKKLANEHFRLGNIYLDMNMSEEAIDEYRKAEKLAPEMADVLVKHGIALRNLGHFDQAVGYLTRAKEINPKFGPARVQMGITYYMKGLLSAAIQEWEEALSAIPDLEQARVYLDLLKQGR